MSIICRAIKSWRISMGFAPHTWDGAQITGPMPSWSCQVVDAFPDGNGNSFGGSCFVGYTGVNGGDSDMAPPNPFPYLWNRAVPCFGSTTATATVLTSNDTGQPWCGKQARLLAAVPPPVPPPVDLSQFGTGEHSCCLDEWSQAYWARRTNDGETYEPPDDFDAMSEGGEPIFPMGDFSNMPVIDSGTAGWGNGSLSPPIDMPASVGSVLDLFTDWAGWWSNSAACNLSPIAKPQFGTIVCQKTAQWRSTVTGPWFIGEFKIDSTGAIVRSNGLPLLTPVASGKVRPSSGDDLSPAWWSNPGPMQLIAAPAPSSTPALGFPVQACILGLVVGQAAGQWANANPGWTVPAQS
jgi:hypothetical protein